MKDLVQKGLYGDNVLELIAECEKRFETDPVVFHVLKALFEKILRRYWPEESDVVSAADMDRLNSSFVPLLTAVLDASSSRRMEVLEELIRAEREFFPSS